MASLTDPCHAHDLEVFLSDEQLLWCQPPRRRPNGRTVCRNVTLDSMAGCTRRQRGVHDLRELNEEAGEPTCS